jgi:hypothetical protein
VRGGGTIFDYYFGKLAESLYIESFKGGKHGGKEGPFGSRVRDDVFLSMGRGSLLGVSDEGRKIKYLYRALADLPVNRFLAWILPQAVNR